MRSEPIWRNPIRKKDDMTAIALRRDVVRTDRGQIAFTVDGFVEHASAAYYGFRPIRINAFVAIGGDLRSTRELAEVGSRYFGVGMIERIEWEGHGHTESSMQ